MDSHAVRSRNPEAQGLAQRVAPQLAAALGAVPFDTAHDPRSAEREIGNFGFRWVSTQLARMNAVPPVGSWLTVETAERRLGVPSRYHRYWGALLRKLSERGEIALREGPEGVEFTATPRFALDPLGDIAAEVAAFEREIEQRSPEALSLFRFMSRCLGRFDDILSGRVDVADVLFAGADLTVFHDVFGGNAVADYLNAVAGRAAALGVIEARRSVAGRPVRVLEVGAGTGATTAALLSALAPIAASGEGDIEFWFTDLSRSFLRHAERRFVDRYPFVRFRALDLEKDLVAQGYELASFDVLVAANVLHDTRDLKRTLKQVRSLLRPGSLLVLDEFTTPKDFLFLSGALLHGYWLFEDPERRQPDSCLASVAQWRSELKAAGFSVADTFTLPTQDAMEGCSECVFLASAPVIAGSIAAPAAETSSGEMAVGDLLRSDILALLGDDREQAFSPQRPLMEMGLDSIELVELKSKLVEQFGIALPSAFLFEHSTPERMTRALAGLVGEERLHALANERSATVPASRGEGARTDRSSAEAIAVVGIACRFPGGANTPAAFWRLLIEGRDGIGTLPPDRWSWPEGIEPNGRHRGIDRGGFLLSIDAFDARFFRISSREAEAMDPQQRLLLELAWEAFEDAGHRSAELAGRAVGVYIGAGQGDYRDLLITTRGADGHVGSGSAPCMLANRISYYFDFHGPSLAIDTACSSSLVALHAAVGALRRGECEQALVGAVNLMASPAITLSYYEARMLSPSGRCRTFDSSADGYVRAEGGAMLVLKPFSQAREDGDAIYGLIKGTAVNHGGQATSLTAPRPDSQAAVVRAAWRDARLPMTRASYIEAHGTGTPLGDPIEIGGLLEAFRLAEDDDACLAAPLSCGIGSVKTNLGHLESAAGLAGLIKVLLALGQRTLPPLVGFEHLNPEIDLARGPLYLVDHRREWPTARDAEGREIPRAAGVSSFGFGGANAHAVVVEAPAHGARTAASDGLKSPRLVPLSARTPELLAESARLLLSFLSVRGQGDESDGVSPRVFEVLEVVRQVSGFELDVAGDGTEGAQSVSDLFWEDLGVGVVEARRLVAALEARFGVPLVARSLVEHPTLGALAKEIDRRSGRLESEPLPDALDEVAFTLLVGREPRAERVAFVVDSLAELARELTTFVAGKPSPWAFRGLAVEDSRQRAAIDDGAVQRPHSATVSRRDLEVHAKRWVNGGEIAAERLFPGPPPRRVHLPTSPFARERHWTVPESGALFAERRGAGSGAGHSLLRPRGGALDLALAIRFDGSEPFLVDHIIGEQKLLPAVVQLELARTACQQALGFAESIRLRDLVWLRPCAVGDEGVRVEVRAAPSESDGSVEFEILSRPLGDRADTSNGTVVLHAQGRAERVATPPLQEIDLAEWRARCAQAKHTASEIYSAFALRGYGYGPSQRGIAEIHRGENALLARLAPWGRVVAAQSNEVGFDPTLADAAVQATFGFALAEAAGDRPPALPFELECCELFAPIASAAWAAVRRRDDSTTFDVDIATENGRVLARFTGLSTRAGTTQSLSPSTTALYAPVWERLPPPISAMSTPQEEKSDGPIAIVGGNHEQHAAIRLTGADARALPFAPDDEIEALVEKLAAWERESGPIAHLIWLVPEDPVTSFVDPAIAAGTPRGSRFVFRALKALLASGYGDRDLVWTVVTFGTQAIAPTDLANPTHASVHGLLGSAANEQENWRVVRVDLEPRGREPWGEVMALGLRAEHTVCANRSYRWFRRSLLPYDCATESLQLPYRKKGVFLVIGGAGGVGVAWSESVVRDTGAQVVWVGRRRPDDAIRAALDRVAAVGPRPLYLEADACDRAALEAVRDEVKRRFGRLDGVVHSAIVLRDQSLSGLSEQDFLAGVAPKVDLSMQIAQAFGDEPLDFVLFFSSMLSQLEWPGQSGYVAGCAGKDAIADRWATERPETRVRTIHWGYWGEIGAAASERHNALMAQKGFGTIRVEPAMAALTELFQSPRPRLAYVPTTTDAARRDLGVSTRERAHRVVAERPETLSAVARSIATQGANGVDLSAADRASISAFEDGLARLLVSRLSEMEPFKQPFATVDELAARGGFEPRHHAWLARSVELMVEYGEPTGEESARPSWLKRREAWLADPEWRPQVELAEAALAALPDVLTGRVAATEVLLGDLFATDDGGAASRVAEVYRRGPLTRATSRALAAAVVAWIDERRRLDPSVRLRILEIGAGTGATSEVLFSALESRAESIETYTFTDLSRAFFAAAPERLALCPSFVSFVPLDIERGADDIDLGSYDLVVATNVLHATRDIATTLRNTKAVLATRGLFALNEIATNSIFHHVTFGLLPGWWRFEDAELRLPGGPALAPEKWRAILGEEGFEGAVFAFGANSLGEETFGQQVIFAASDGFVRQAAVPTTAESSEPERQREQAAASTPKAALSEVAIAIDPSPEGIGRLLDAPREVAHQILLDDLRVRVALVLGAKPESLDSIARPFAASVLAEFGMDSLSSNSLRHNLRRELGIEVPVQRIIADRVDLLVAELYERLLVQRMRLLPPETDEEMETFVF